MQADPKAGPTFARLVGRVIGERNEGLQKFMMGELAEVIIQFSAAFETALPGLAKEETDWRSHFMAGSMAHTLCNADLLVRFTGTDAGCPTMKQQCALIDFTAAGFRAKGQSAPEKSPGKASAQKEVACTLHFSPPRQSSCSPVAPPTPTHGPEFCQRTTRRLVCAQRSTGPAPAFWWHNFEMPN
ncbi:MAG: hypothetical protein CM1200mP29_05200 [Verrucomicrobiota bacterium]|nr:MAG: hypothetical protein CM1200mP29_05200 [Verrucomicrobiota bacterium]